MNVKTTITLLVLLLIVGGLFFFVERKAPTTREVERQAAQTADAQGEPLFSDAAFAPDRVRRIEITHGGRTYEFTRENDKWQLTAPARFAAQTPTLPTEAATLRYTARFEPGDKDFPALDRIQLDPPQASIAFHMEDGKSQTLRLGRRGAGGRGYAMVNDDKRVYYIGDALHTTLLERGVTSLLANRLEVPSVGQVDRVTLRRESDEIELAKQEGQWTFGGASWGRADQEAVDQLLGAARALWINRYDIVGGDELSLYGLTSPRAVLSMHVPAIGASVSTDGEASDEGAQAPAAAEKTLTLRIGAPVDARGDSFFASWSRDEEPSRVVFRVNDYDAKKLEKTVDDLRDARVTPLSEESIKQVLIVRPSAPPLVLERTSQGFAFGDPAPGYALDQDAAGQLVARILQARAERYIPDAAPEDVPAATITLTALGKAEPDTLRLFAADDEHWMALRNEETTGYVVKRGDLAGVFDPPIALRDRLVLDLTPQSLKRITIGHPDGRTFTLERELAQPAAGAANAQPAPGPWKLEGYDRIETDALDALIEALTPLTAERWLSDPAGLGDGVLTVSLETFDGSSHTLRVDPATRHASLDDHSDGFVLDDFTLGALTTELRYRTLLSTPVDRIQKIEIRRGGTSLTVTRDESGLYIASEGQVLNQEATGALVDTLGALRAERFLGEADAANLGDDAVTLTITFEDDDDPRVLTLTAEGDAAMLSGVPLAFELGQEVRGRLLAPLAAEPAK